MTAPTATERGTSRRATLRAALILTAAVAVAIAINAVIAALAVQAGAPAAYGPLTPPAYGSFTVIGIVVGWFGWRIVERRAARPRRALAILVPLVLVLSFLPDMLLLTLRFIPGTTTTAVLALMAMHVAVVAVAVPAYVLASRALGGRSATAPGGSGSTA